MQVKITYPGSLEKNVIDFSDLIAKADKTVLYFYPKDNTPGCTVQANDFSLMVESFKEHGCQIVGVSKDTHGSHCKFIEKQNIAFPLIADQDKILMDADHFDVLKEKSMFGKKYMGVDRSTFVLDSSGNVLLSYRGVSAKGHAEKVLEDIAGL